MLDKESQLLFALTQRLFGPGVGGAQAKRLNAKFEISGQFCQQIDLAC